MYKNTVWKVDGCNLGPVYWLALWNVSALWKTQDQDSYFWLAYYESWIQVSLRQSYRLEGMVALRSHVDCYTNRFCVWFLDSFFGIGWMKWILLAQTRNVGLSFLWMFCIALKGSHFWFLFDFTAAGVVPCGGRKTSPRTSTIVQFIFYFGSLRSAIIFWEIRNKWLV